MGWASGSELANNIWNIIEAYLPKEKQAELALLLVNEFEEMDCDTMEELDFVNELLYCDEETCEWKIK